ncbi:helix-turn-helix domain-containing protein [Planctomycetota bacterium]
MKYANIPSKALQALSDLTPKAIKVLIVIALHMNKGGTCYPSRERLRDMTGLKTVASISRAIAELRRAGVICVKQRRGTNIFSWGEKVTGGDTVKDSETVTKKNTVKQQTVTKNDTAAVTKNDTALCINNTILTKNKYSTNDFATHNILAAYAKLKPPRLDQSRSRAKKHLDKLLVKYSEGDLLLAVARYRQGCLAADVPEQFRRGAGNFFGRDGDFETYLCDGYEPPINENQPEPLPESYLDEIEAIAAEVQAGK